MNKTSFPIHSMFTKIPQGFVVSGLSMAMEHLEALDALHCTSVYLVHCPVGWDALRGGTVETPHLDFYFLLSGSMTIETADGIQRAHHGQLMIQPSWLDRRFWHEEDTDYIYLRFDQPRERFAVQGLLIRTCRNLDAVAMYTRSLLVNNHALPWEAEYRSHLASCLAILCRRELCTPETLIFHEEEEELLSQLQRADAGHLTVLAAARAFGKSLSSFRKFCLAHFDKSPQQVINEVRVARAQVLLSDDDYSIKEIATQLGYADRYAFSKAFLRLTGQTPGHCRKASKLPRRNKPPHGPAATIS